MNSSLALSWLICPIYKKIRSLELSHGLEEAPVVHQLDPDQEGHIYYFYVVLDLLVQIFDFGRRRRR